jgi:hypothetical protein
MGHMAALGRPRATASIGYRHPAPTPSPLHLWVHSALATAFSASAFWATVDLPPSGLLRGFHHPRCAAAGAPGVEKANLSSVRYVIGGVVPLTRHLLEAVERRCDPQVLEGHGLTDRTCVRA